MTKGATKLATPFVCPIRELSYLANAICPPRPLKGRKPIQLPQALCKYIYFLVLKWTPK